MSGAVLGHSWGRFVTRKYFPNMTSFTAASRRYVAHVMRRGLPRESSVIAKTRLSTFESEHIPEPCSHGKSGSLPAIGCPRLMGIVAVKPPFYCIYRHDSRQEEKEPRFVRDR